MPYSETWAEHYPDGTIIPYMDKKAREAIGEGYNPPYSAGQAIMYEGITYVANTAISSDEIWTPAHWTASNVCAMYNELKSNLTELGTAQSKIFKNAQTIVFNLKNAPSGDNAAQALMFNANQGMCAIVRMDSALSVTNILGSMGWTISNSGSTITITPSLRLWGATSVIVDEIN